VLQLEQYFSFDGSYGNDFESLKGSIGGGWMSHVGLQRWWRQQEKVLQLEKYLSFDSSYCIDFESQDELRCNFWPYLPAVDDFNV
jgi:hypothetical protein